MCHKIWPPDHGACMIMSVPLALEIESMDPYPYLFIFDKTPYCICSPGSLEDCELIHVLIKGR